MAKRLCKLNRREIAADLSTIHALVREPQYLCRACARSSAEKTYLCKPDAIPLASQPGQAGKGSTLMPAAGVRTRKSAKRLKKAAKKQSKLKKKLQKVAKKQQKLARCQEKLEQKIAQAGVAMKGDRKESSAKALH